MADEAEWEPQHSGLRGPDPGEFAPIALGLQRFTASEIAGISGSRCRSRRDTGGASRCPTSVTGCRVASLAGVELPVSVRAW